MKRLFLKIFMWFWATAILTGFALVLVVMLQHRQIRPEDHKGLAQTVRYFGTAAADITERNGSVAGSEYIKQLSHDVRIQACLFSETGKPISGEDPALSRIERDVQRLNEMIGRLQAVTKLENSSTLLNPAPLALSDLLRSIASDADFEAQKNRSHVTVVNAPDVSMIGDYSLLRSAIENVVRNAVRHTKPDTSVDIKA